MTSYELNRDYLVSCRVDWCNEPTTDEEFAFWLDCNGFHKDDERTHLLGQHVWSRSHLFDIGEIVFLAMIAQHMLPKVYYYMEVKFTPRESESVVYSSYHKSENTISYVNVYKNINLAMAMAINNWNNKVFDMKKIGEIPLIPNHWMIPITRVITTVGKL